MKNNLAIFQIAPCTWHTWAGNCDQDFDDGKNYQWNCQNAVDFWEKIGQKIRVSSKWNSKNTFWPFSKIPIVGTYFFLTATFMKSQCFVFPKSNAIVISVISTKVLWYGSEGRKRYDHIETRFIALFYGKNEVSAETIFIFIFYCATVSRENFIKLAVLFSDYFGIKNKTGWWFHDFKGHKIMKPPEVDREKNETDGTRLHVKLWHNKK